MENPVPPNQKKQYLSSNKATNVSHITEQKRPTLIRHSSKPGVVPVPRVSTPTTNNQLGPKVQRLLLQPIVIDIPSARVHLVRQALEVDRGGGDLLAPRGVVAMREVAPRGQIQAHDPVVGLEDGGVGGEICGGAGVGLDIDAPGLGVDVEGLEGSGAAEVLDLVDELVAAVVAVAGHALRVLVGEGAAEGLDHGERREVLGGDELDAAALAPLLLLDEVVDFGVHGVERGVPPLVYWIHFSRGGRVRERKWL